MATTKSPLERKHDRVDKQREHERVDKQITDLQNLIDSVRLDGKITAAKVSELGRAIKQKLNVSLDEAAYNDMAKSMLRMNVDKQYMEAESESPSKHSPFKQEQEPLDVPTWSQDSSSPEPVQDPSFSSRSTEPISEASRSRSPAPSRAPRSPAPPTNPEGMNRGRSPSRSNNANVPRHNHNRSRTPVDRLLRRRAPTPDKQATPRSRSKSPFRTVFRRGGSGYHDLPVESSPSVYYESHMNMESVLGGTPTPQRVPQRPENQTPASTSRQPFGSMDLDPNGNVMSPPAGMPPRDAGATTQSPSVGHSHAPNAESPIHINLESPNHGPSLKNLRLDDVQFNIGSSKPTTPKSVRSPSEIRQRRSGRRSFPKKQTPSNIQPDEEDVSAMFSPMEDTPPPTKESSSAQRNTPNRPWQEDVDMHRGSSRSKSRSNPRIIGWGKNSTKLSDSGTGDEPVRHRSRSPFRHIFASWRGNNPPPPPPPPPPGAPLNSPIPTFQPPEALFADSGPVDRRQTTPPSMQESVGSDMGGRRQTAPSNMAAAAAAASSEVGPKTPYEANNQNSRAPETMDTAVNKKGRNTATPVMADDSNIQFQVNLTKSKSKNKAKRGMSFRRGLGGSMRLENVGSYSTGIPTNTTDDSSPTASETTADSRTNYNVNAASFEQSVGERDHGRKQSPMNIDQGTQQPQGIPAGFEETIQFNIGVGDKSPTGKSRFKRRENGQRERATKFQQRSQSAYFPSHDMPKDIPDDPLMQASSTDSMNSTGGSVGQRPHFGRSYSVNESNMHSNYSAKRAMVMALREEGKSHYISGDYRSSILKYTSAIQIYTSDCLAEATNDLLAVLLSNRAAGLLMVGSFQAAVEDCQKALEFVSDPATYVISSDAGPVLQSKLYTRMARALLKLGEADLADGAFDQAIETSNTSLKRCMQRHDSVQLEIAQKGLGQVVTEATLGKTEVARFRDAMGKIISCTQSTIQMSRSSERERNLAAVGHVNMALSTATGCAALHEQKVSLLASLKRWREVASHCDRLAAANTKLDGCFSEDLASKNPFLGVPPAKFLTPDFFRDLREDDIQGAELKLNSKSTAEAILRIPHSMTPYYVRALRLEERYPAAEASVRTLEQYVLERSGVYDQEKLRKKFAWLPREHDRLNRTKSEREKGDELFRNGEFDRAAAKYAACLAIDSEGFSEEIDGSSAGGRLHAVLHCNRAACLMAVRRFHEAVTECTAALRIHPRYMKALLRRARCYSRLDRLEEAVAEFKRWVDMVNQVRNDPQSISVLLSPCLFDGPHDVSEGDIAQVKQEMDEVVKVKSKVEAGARAEAAYRQQRQKWQSQSFNNEQQGDAQRRRDYFYSQKSTSSRRWDSFTDKGPKKSSKTSSKGPPREQNSSNKKSPKNEQKSSNKKSPKNIVNENDHYIVLQLKSTATAAEIKKAYRKMALKYHPDKNSDPGAVDLFRRVTQAYEVLNDSTSRRKYDAESRWGRRS